MQCKKVNLGYGYVIRLEKGEKLVESLLKFTEREGKKCHGFFYGIGSVKNTSLGYREDKKKEYKFEELSQTLELVYLNGNICDLDGKPFVHCHAMLAEPDLLAFGGHINEAEVAVTAEIFL